jgi:hypothetical protein
MATPAELLQMTDEELKAYIPTKYMRAGQPGEKGISITPSPEEFRATLQTAVNFNPKPGEKGYGMPLTNYVTNAERDAESKRLSEERATAIANRGPETQLSQNQLIGLNPPPYGFEGADGGLFFGGGGSQQPIATDIQQQFRTLDPTTRELFFGSGIPGTSSYSPGFMQQAFRASEKTFYDEQGNPIVVPEQVAGLSPEQLAAIGLSREKIGVQDPFLQQSQQAYGSGLESLFGGLGESEQALRDYASAEYDPSSYQQYMDPYQEQVIDQVRKDILEQGAKGDISARASDIARGGESAFGSRARLGAGERTEALGRGLGEALGGLRSQGFQQAQQTAMGEFGRQQQAQQGLAQGLSSLAGAKQAGQFGAGQAYAGLGGQAQQAAQADIQRQLGLGQMTQGQQQNQLNAARQNALMQQQAPMQQMQSLLPFVQSVPAGFSQIGTTYGVQPSALQTGLGAGLSALGGIGSFFNPPQYKVG